MRVRAERGRLGAVFDDLHCIAGLSTRYVAPDLWALCLGLLSSHASGVLETFVHLKQTDTCALRIVRLSLVGQGCVCVNVYYKRGTTATGTARVCVCRFSG